MTDRKQATEHTTIMTEYGSHPISEFIKELQKLQSERWEKIELKKKANMTEITIMSEQLKPAPKLTLNITIALQQKIR